MKSKNPATRKRQRYRRKERLKSARKMSHDHRYEALAAKYSPYKDEKAKFSSCANKNRYATEEQAIYACIKCSRDRGVVLRWYKCRNCGGWHITSRCDDEA